MADLDLPLTGMPALVLDHGAIGASSFPRPGSYSNRNAFWVLNLMGGDGVLDLDGEILPFTAGSAVLTPPGLAHVYRIPRPVPFVHAHFRAVGDVVGMRAVLPLGKQAAARHQQLMDAARRVAAEPERATVALWHLLWELSSGPARPAAPVHHPVLRELLAHLAEHPADRLRPALLAKRFSTTRRHLDRLCNAAFGLPLAAWIRRERLRRARQLLSETDWPVAVVARTVGYPDPQHFNKAMRAFTGMAPSGLRQVRN